MGGSEGEEGGKLGERERERKKRKKKKKKKKELAIPTHDIKLQRD